MWVSGFLNVKESMTRLHIQFFGVVNDILFTEFSEGLVVWRKNRFDSKRLRDDRKYNVHNYVA